MSAEGGLMMFRGFHSKATNSLFALILHIVFNLLSLFSIIFCPPSLSVLLVSPKNAPSRPHMQLVEALPFCPQSSAAGKKTIFEIFTLAVDVQPRR